VAVRAQFALARLWSLAELLRDTGIAREAFHRVLSDAAQIHA
jgi:hypothetical protein